MRALIQRVKEAAVVVDGAVVSSIGRGIMVLIGLSAKDTQKDFEYIVRKLLNLRLFPNEDCSRRWDKSVRDLQLEILCVSQFTLYTELKGNRLDFRHAMDPSRSQPAYAEFISQLRAAYAADLVKDGIFGAKMDVRLTNDGPVTIQLDSSPGKSVVIPSTNAENGGASVDN